MDEFDADAIAERADAALVAYPHKAAALAVKELRERGLKVVDLSADFRLDAGALRALVPAARGARAAGGRRSTGCRRSATATRSARPTWWPARAATRPPRCWGCGRCATCSTDAVVDIKSGVSGSGREATQETHYVSAADNVNPYKTEGHRHSAELEQELPGVAFTFVPHLVPVDQGLMATSYVDHEVAT